MAIIEAGRPGRLLCAGFAAVGLVLLAGCGSSADSTGTTAPTTGAPGPGGSAEYTNCLAQNGVTVDRPSGGAPPSGAPQGAPPSGAPRSAPPTAAGGRPPAPEGVDENTWTAATEACKNLMPSPPSGGAAPPSARN
jgi:hypothetical protein